MKNVPLYIWRSQKIESRNAHDVSDVANRTLLSPKIETEIFASPVCSTLFLPHWIWSRINQVLSRPNAEDTKRMLGKFQAALHRVWDQLEYAQYMIDLK